MVVIAIMGQVLIFMVAVALADIQETVAMRVKVRPHLLLLLQVAMAKAVEVVEVFGDLEAVLAS
jgi:hypothetical protein